MKRYITIGFNQGEDKYWPVRRMLQEIGCADELRGLDTPFPGLYSRTFDADDPKLQELSSALRKAGFRWDEVVNRVYDDAELRQYPLLRLGLRRPLFDAGVAPAGTTYDLSKGCSECGTGSMQVSPLMVAASRLPKSGLIFGSYGGNFFVRKELAAAFREAEVSGLELRQVHGRPRNKPLPVWQMISTYTMPRAAEGMLRDSSPGWGCTACERDMWCPKEDEDIAYVGRQVDLEPLPDVVQTWECYGRSLLYDDPERELVRGFAHPFLMVKIKVFEIFRKLKVKQIEFMPVRIIEGPEKS